MAESDNPPPVQPDIDEIAHRPEILDGLSPERIVAFEAWLDGRRAIIEQLAKQIREDPDSISPNMLLDLLKGSVAENEIFFRLLLRRTHTGRRSDMRLTGERGGERHTDAEGTLIQNDIAYHGSPQE